MPEFLLCCALLCSHCRLYCALRSCLLLLQLCFLLNYLRSSAFSPFFTGFCHFRISHTSLSAIFHTSLSPFFFLNSCVFSCYLSFLLPDEQVGETSLNLLSVVLPSFVFPSVVLCCAFLCRHCRFSARFGAAFCCINFAFC